MTTLMSALAERAAGRVDDAGLARVALHHRMLHAEDGEKTAASPAAASTIGQRVLEALGKGIEHSVPMIVAGLGVTSAAALGRGAMDKATKGRDLERILEVYPHLKEYPRAEIELAYSSLRHMNPHMAKDPLAGGTLLGQMLRNRDPMNPKLLRFDTLAGDLLRLNPKEEHAFEEVARDAVMKGMSHGIEDLSKERAARGQQAFMQEMERGKREFDTSRDALRAQREDKARQEDTAEKRRASALEQRRRAELERAKHEWGRGAKWEEHGWKREDEADRRAWQTGQSATDQAAQDRRAVLSAMLSKTEADDQVYDSTLQRNVNPTISSVLHKHYPHLRP